MGVAVRVVEAALARSGMHPPAALLVLGHMRSGSTLLLHVLLTNPAIAALGERNAIYTDSSDLARLAMRTRLAGHHPLRRIEYVADQINHSRFTPEPALLDHPRVRPLFLIREPAATLASLLELTRTHYEPWSPSQAVDYYVERLATLAAYGQGLAHPERAHLLTYEALTQQPAPTLAALQAALGTAAPFSERYPTHAFTGKRGDPSANIRSGRIGAPRPLAGGGPPLPAAELARAAAAHERCLRALAPLAL